MKIWLIAFALFAAMPAQAHAFVFLAALPAIASTAAAAATATTAATFSAATLLTIGAGALSAISTIAGARAESSQIRSLANSQAEQQEQEALLEGTAALQRDTQNREQLDEVLGSIRAARGERGTASPTGSSFLTEANQRLSSDRTVEFLSGRQRESDLNRQAQQTRIVGRHNARQTMNGAYLKAGFSLFKTGAAVY